MLDYLKSFSNAINAAIGLTTLGTIIWSMLSYVYGMKDDVATLRNDVARIQMEISEIRTQLMKGK